MRRGATTAVAAIAVVAPTAARAQDAVPATAPAATQLSLRVERIHSDAGRRVVLRGDALRIVGTLGDFVPGQKATVRITRRGKRLAAKRVAINAGAEGTGRFRLSYRPRRSGRLTIRAVHDATPELAGARSRAVRVSVLTPRASAGARGPVVRLLQRGLRRLGYAVPSSGTFDGGTSRAVMAFRKVNGMRRAFAADASLIRRVLRGSGRFRARHPGAGRHVEADVSRQVLALLDGRRVVRTYHTSSGAPATPTILGSFRVYSKTPGTNASGMVHSSYFRGGYAIHGYRSVPAFPASHGCLRVPIPDARSIFDWIRYGTRVIVYR